MPSGSAGPKAELSDPDLPPGAGRGWWERCSSTPLTSPAAAHWLRSAALLPGTRIWNPDPTQTSSRHGHRHTSDLGAARPSNALRQQGLRGDPHRERTGPATLRPAPSLHSPSEAGRRRDTLHSVPCVPGVSEPAKIQAMPPPQPGRQRPVLSLRRRLPRGGRWNQCPGRVGGVGRAAPATWWLGGSWGAWA